MSFYNSVSATSQIPGKLAPIVNKMAVDAVGPTAGQENGQQQQQKGADSRKQTPTESDDDERQKEMDEDNNGGYREVTTEATDEGYTLVTSGKQKGASKSQGQPASCPSTKGGQGRGKVKKENLKHKLEKEEAAESDGSAASNSSRAKARRASKAAGALVAPVGTQPAVPTHVFVEEDERKYLVQCCSDGQLLQGPNYYQSLEVLRAKYAIDGSYFLMAVNEKDEAYFSRIMIKGTLRTLGHTWGNGNRGQHTEPSGGRVSCPNFMTDRAPSS